MAHEARIPLGAGTQFDLPEICVVTGQRHGVEWRSRDFIWTPPWVFVLILLNVLILLIVAMVVRKRVKLELPYAPGVYDRWRKGAIGSGLVVVLGIVLMVAGFAMMAVSEGSSPVLLWLGLAVVVGSLVGMIVGARVLSHDRGPKIKKVTKTEVILLLPSAEAAQAINDRFSGATIPKPPDDWQPVSASGG
jgi:hypothetical protein